MHLHKQLDRIIVVVFLCVILGSVFLYQIYAPNDAIPRGNVEQTLNELTSPKLAQSAGNPDWNLTWGGTQDDYEGFGSLDPTGEYLYNAGSTKSFGAGDFDAFIIKYAINKTQIWNRTWGGSQIEVGYDLIIEETTGNVYQVGRTESFASGSDAFIVKWAPEGTQIWNRTWGRPGLPLPDYAADVVLDSNGNLFICGGTVSQGEGMFDAFIAKYDSSGTQQWNLTWGGSNDDTAMQIVIDSSGNIIIGGYTRSYSVADYDTCVVKYDSSGIQVWNRTWGGMGDDEAVAIKADADGNIYLAGETNSFGSGGYDGLLVKYDQNGVQLWNRTLGGTLNEIWRDIMVDSQKNLYIVGTSGSYGAGGTDCLFTMYSPTGTCIWNQTWGGTGDESAMRLTSIGNETFFIFGTTSSWGAGMQDSLIIRICHKPEINSSGDLVTNYGTTGHTIVYTIYDAITLVTTYTVYMNESIYGTENQVWTAKIPILIHVDGFGVGDFNFTLFVQDGYGFSAQMTVLVSILPTNGIWQEITPGFQTLYCADRDGEYAGFYLEGITTGGRINITMLGTNPLSATLPGGIRYYSIDVDGWNKVNFPVPGKFFYQNRSRTSMCKNCSFTVYFCPYGNHPGGGAAALPFLA